MKALIVAAALAATAPPDWKHEQFQIIAKDEVGILAASTPVQDSKDVRHVDILIVYRTPFKDGTTATYGRIEFNCTLSQIRYGWQYAIGADHSTLTNRQEGDKEFEKVDPRTYGGSLFSHTCGYAPQPSVST